MKRTLTCKSDEWGTPTKHFLEWDKEFNFTLDPCGIKSRPLKKDMITLDIRDGQDGLKHDWGGERVFVNPPYSNDNVHLWCRKCFWEKNNAELIILLIPASKGSSYYFHDYIYPFAEVRFICGRLKFVPMEGQQDSSNPQGSILCIIHNNQNEPNIRQTILGEAPA